MILRECHPNTLRRLALQALRAKAIDPCTYDAIDESPHCALECTEFIAWATTIDGAS